MAGRHLLLTPLLTIPRVHAETVCEPIWEEDFTGPLDRAVWNVVEGDGCAEGICGWGNNEAQSYDEAGVSVSEGVLSLTAFIDGQGQIRSGKLTTAGKHSFKYGYIEARIRLPQGRGLWPAFWMMPEGQLFGWPLEGEIDILEWTGHDPHRIIGAIHFGDLPPDNVHYSETLRTPAPWSGDFHIYGIEWSAERIAWYANNRIHGSATPNDILPWPWVFDDKSFYLIVNMAVGGTLGGEVVPGDLPATAEFDWIRVYPEGCRTGRSPR
jgi:beta-glucanase (GH16 family)